MSKNVRKQQPPIAIVGIGALFPESPSLAKFWANIVAGADLITDIPDSHWKVADYYSPDLKAPDMTYARRGGFLPEVPFDTLGFGIPPNLLPSTDTSQLLALLVARTTLEDAFGGSIEGKDKSRISCLLGVTSGQELFGQMASRLRRPEWLAGMRAAGVDEETAKKAADKISDTMVPWTESTFPGLLGNVVAGRICNRLDLGGTNAVCDAACASSFAALSMGLDELTLGRADMVLAGGVDTLNDIFMHMCFSKTPALSMGGTTKPFDKDADGTLLGEGLGMVALKRLEDAEANGDRIYAVIKGLGSSSDGRSKSVYAPVSEGQASALKRAYVSAGFSSGDVELVEGHGTGTKAGDVAEVGGLNLAFADSGRDDKQWCALGSVKSQIGHTKSTAGAAGLIKVAMALHEKVLPPTLNVTEPNPKADFPNSPFYVNTKARPWVRANNHPRRAGVSAFGFGGSNFHVAVEEYTGPSQRPGRFSSRSVEVFGISGPTRAYVAEEASILAARLQKSDKTLREEAQKITKKFKSSQPKRLTVVARDVQEAADLLAKAADALERGNDPTGPAIAFGEGKPGKVAFIFPGQGSQYVGMAGDLAMAFPEALAALDEVDSAALEGADVALSRVMLPHPSFTDEESKAQAEKLKATEWAQPALGAAELATLAVMERLGMKPDLCAGHSFGELTALCAAGVFSKQDLMKIARKRGLLMAAASEIDGAMAAVSAPADKIMAAIKDHQDVVLANENAPAQTVIAGPTDAVIAAMATLKEAGMKARRLEVSTAFHSPLVQDAVPQLKTFLDEIKIGKPSVPVYANATAGEYTNKPAEIRKLLSSQIGKTVKFVDQINAMYDAGARVFIEVGPGAVLTGLVGRILKKDDVTVVATDARNGDTTRAVLVGVARAAAAGVPVDFSPLFEGFEIEAPRKKGKLDIYLNGSNYGKPDLPKPAAVTVKPTAAPATKALPAGPANKASPAPVSSPTLSSPNFPNTPSATVASAPASIAATRLSAPAKREARPMTSPPDTPPNDAGWLTVFREGQRQTADAHNAFQQAIAETHVQFLQAFESSSAQLAALLSGAEVPASAPMTVRPLAVQPPALQPAAVQAAPLQPAAMQPAPVPVAVPMAAAPVAAAATAPPAPAASSGQDYTEMFLEIVAEKTGYPRDALDLEMELEADLGIDSIKRVEILSALKETAPDLPDLDAMEASSLRTLKAIAEALGTGTSSASPSAAPAAASGINVTDTFLEIVAEKTGYPRDALELTMELEADLGIDSIKRVEILSALKEAAPELPDLDAMEASQLRTLQAICDSLGAGLEPAVPATDATAAPAAGGPMGSDDVLNLFLEVVAEKTGYPRDALDLNMELEADLGIDSIKRVEILSALKEAAPSLPDLDAMQASQLRTLQAIADALSDGSDAAGSDASGNGASSDANGTSTKSGSDDKTARAAQTWEETPSGKGRRPQLPSGRAVAICTPKAKLTDGLVERLNKVGIRAIALDGGELNGQTTEIGGLIVVTGGQKKPDKALADLKRAFFDVQKSGPALRESAAAGGALLFGVQLCGKGQDRGGAVSGGLGGLIKTAALEWEGVASKVIDLDVTTVDAIADALLVELEDGTEDIEVRYRGGKRLLPVMLQVDNGVALQSREERPTAVVTGGARGVTATCVQRWAEQTKGKIALFGRTPLETEPAAAKGASSEGDLVKVLFAEAKAAGEKVAPAKVKKRAQKILAQREVRATIASLEKAGAEVAYITADAGDRASVKKALEQTREKFGPIHVIVHGAGVLADRKIEDKTAEQLDMVLQTKASGALYLLELTDADPIDTICFFASVAGVTGNVGQCDYAMANEVLGHLADAEQARRPEARVRSLAWGPWAGGMVTPELKAHFEARGIPLIPLAGGARVFVEELEGTSAAPGSVEVVGATLDGLSPLPRTVRLRLAGERLRLLDDHRIRGGAVLPAALASELMLEAGRRVLGRRPAELQKLNVLRGVRLDEGPLPKFVDFEIEVAELGGEVTATLRLPGDKGPRYRAVLAKDAGPAIGVAPSISPTGQTTDRPLYPDRLFHGPLFHVVDTISGSDDAGMKATIKGRGAKAWPDDGKWLLDVAAVDAGLQLLLLYGEDRTGHGYLPTTVARVVGGREAIGEVQCLLVPKEVTRDKVHADIWFVDVQGNVPLALLDAVAIRIPDAQPAVGASA